MPVFVHAKGKLLEIQIRRYVVPGRTVTGSITGIRGRTMEQVGGEQDHRTRGTFDEDGLVFIHLGPASMSERPITPRMLDQFPGCMALRKHPQATI